MKVPLLLLAIAALGFGAYGLSRSGAGDSSPPTVVVATATRDWRSILYPTPDPNVPSNDVARLVRDNATATALAARPTPVVIIVRQPAPPPIYYPPPRDRSEFCYPVGGGIYRC